MGTTPGPRYQAGQAERRARMGVPSMPRPLACIPIAVVLVGSLQTLSTATSLSAPDDSGRSHSRTIRIGDSVDLPPCEFPPNCPNDIRFVAMRTYTGGTGRRMGAVKVGAYELYGGLIYAANYRVRFDTRRGRRADRHVVMALADRPGDYGWNCGRRFGDRHYRIRVRGNAMTCFIPSRALHPTKPIRFKARSRGAALIVTRVADRAPDDGWAG